MDLTGEQRQVLRQFRRLLVDAGMDRLLAAQARRKTARMPKLSSLL